MRPLRHVEGKPAIKYKKRFHRLINGSEVWIDDVEPIKHQRKSGTSRVAGKVNQPQSPLVRPDQIKWDPSQRDVIGAPPEDRLLISAGPGTGKTAVACARVSHLINHCELEPSRIWLISFTRTAVREIRDRIAASLNDDTAAFAVKIATLDSHAWTIHSGFDDQARVLGAYEENIERVLELIREEENVSEYLADNVEHLIVDEAQDIVGIRADLVVEFICRISTASGVSVFADEAQAIYGFADDREIQLGESVESTLPAKLRANAGDTFREFELTEVHRTHSSQLLKIFSDVRRKVLTSVGKTGHKLEEITDDVIDLADGVAPNINDEFPRELEDAFILYRRRCDVLMTSSMLTTKGIPHRVRMSGLPVYLSPWIASIFCDQTNVDLNIGKFMDLWAQRVHGTSFAIHEPDEAWAHLVRIAGRTRTVVDMRRLRQRLGRKQPPAELCHSELGVRGPIVGTIHGSKGREAEIVHLMLPQANGENVDEDEESRVVFVGATRGRSQLLTGQGWRQNARRIEDSGRAYRLQTKGNKPRAQFEIGRDNDIGAEGLTGRVFYRDAEAASAAQTRILALGDKSVSLIAESDHDAGFAYRIKEPATDECIAVLSSGVNTDMFTIGKAIQAKLRNGRRRPPEKIPHLHLHGVRTIVLPPDSPEIEKLHEPWKSSGFILAPSILAYTTAFFPCASGKKGG